MSFVGLISGICLTPTLTLLTSLRGRWPERLALNITSSFSNTRAATPSLDWHSRASRIYKVTVLYRGSQFGAHSQCKWRQTTGVIGQIFRRNNSLDNHSADMYADAVCTMGYGTVHSLHIHALMRLKDVSSCSLSQVSLSAQVSRSLSGLVVNR